MVPAQIRKLFQLKPADRLEWLVDVSGIRVLPVRADPVLAFRGQGKGKSVKRLLEDTKLELKS